MPPYRMNPNQKMGMVFTSSVVPDSVVGELHGVRVLCLLKVLVGVSADIPSTSYVATD